MLQSILATLQLFVKKVSSFTRSKYMQAVQKFKNSALDLTTPCCGYFVMREIGLAKIYP